MEKQGVVPVVDTPGDEPCAQIWSVYISEAEKYDKALVDGWITSMSGLLIFAGLFSAILTAFIVESYKLLDRTPDPLVQLTIFALQNPGIPFDLAAFNHPPSIPGPPPTAAVVCNVLWFIALGLSLASALTATLVDQWAREFLQHTEMLPSPVKRARIFAYLYYGLQRFRMHAIVGLIPLLLHLSLLFFFGGLVAFLLLVSNLVAFVAAALLAVVALIYGAMTLLPLLQFDCPYKTPLSNILWSARRYLLRLLDQHRLIPKNSDSPQLHSMVDAMINRATVRSDPREERDKRALAWTMKSLADDDELEPFVEGIPNAIWGSTAGRRRKYDNLIIGLLKDPQVQLGSRIEHLMLSCDSGLLEANVKMRRQVSCLKAIWCLGMMAEMGEQDMEGDNSMVERRRFWNRRGNSVELVDVESAHKSIPELQPWEKPRLPTMEQPLSSFQGLRFLPEPSAATAQYLLSITALAQWNDLCALNGHVEKVSELLKPRAGADAPNNYYYCKRSLEALLTAHRTYIWRHVIPTGLDGEQNLEMLVKAPPPVDIADWMIQVGRIIQQMPLSWNKVQYRILHSFLRASAAADKMPYEFELTCQTIRPSAPNTFDNDMVGNVLTTFSDNVQKATKRPTSPDVTHVDTVLGILLPWFDQNKDLDLHVVQRITDSVIEYINNREQDDAIERVLRDCDITRIWEHITDRLVTGRAEWLSDVSKAMWKLTMLFPGPSAPDSRLQTWPRFDAGTLSVIPVAPYAVSVIALLRTHILNAYEANYAPQDSEVKTSLHQLKDQLVSHVKVNASQELKRALYDVKDGWALMTAVYGVLVPLPLKGLPLEPMPVLATSYTIERPGAYEKWRANTMDAVEEAIKLGGRLERRVDQARFGIAIEFMQYCAAVQRADDLPYHALDTFTDHILRGLFVQDPPHVDSQRSFVEALRGLAVAGTMEHSELARAVLDSSLFAGRDELKLPWLDDLVALRASQDVFHDHLPFFTKSGLGILRKVEDILGWLEAKANLLENGFADLFLTTAPTSPSKFTALRLGKAQDPVPPDKPPLVDAWPPAAGPSNLGRMRI